MSLRFVPPREPLIGEGGLVSDIARRLSNTDDDPGEMVKVISAALGHPVALLDPDGRVIAGDLPADTSALLADVGPNLSGRRPTQWLSAIGQDMLVGQPIRLAKDAPANLWLAAQVPAAAPHTARTASQVLSVAAWAFVAYLAARSLRQERSCRRSAALLAELLDQAESPNRWILEAATAAGWRLSGWHVAVHVVPQPDGTIPATGTMSELIEDRLAAQGLPAEPVMRLGGWSLWITTETEPDAGHLADVVSAVRRALLAAEREFPGLRLCAGVGNANAGTVGLRRSMLESHHACLLAGARNIPGAVEQIGTSTVKRLLTNCFLPHQQYEIADRILRPLTVADPSRQLLGTLGHYLDNESSATATAAALGVHRNTVLQRLERVRSLLPVDLGNADERLAVQLAIRLIHSGPRAGRDVTGIAGDQDPPPIPHQKRAGDTHETACQVRVGDVTQDVYMGPAAGQPRRREHPGTSPLGKR